MKKDIYGYLWRIVLRRAWKISYHVLVSMDLLKDLAYLSLSCLIGTAVAPFHRGQGLCLSGGRHLTIIEGLVECGRCVYPKGTQRCGPYAYPLNL